MQTLDSFVSSSLQLFYILDNPYDGWWLLQAETEYTFDSF